ncbi:choice-of-anchor I family protein [Geminicoccus roseus]|uniref:choice-of-anchor I family protein n=1 Tax=Geminicoccus roseus TaxID=404900 RepID=UPI0003FADD6E|nr:choice-of-anchor I family protein [Geminicoccus roseus]
MDDATNQETWTIPDVQGDDHVSPLLGRQVEVTGIVTALSSNGFYLQDPQGDGDDATSDAVFVFTRSAPTVAVGDELSVAGMVSEFTPGGASSGNLSTTQISLSTSTLLSSGNALPAATVIGQDGRQAPGQVIDDDGLSSFDPNSDGIDFYESMEGMRVEVRDAVAASPTNAFGEIALLPDGGEGAGVRTDAGGIALRPDDANPERIIVDDALVANPPAVNVGDRFDGPVTGVLDYSFGNFKLLNTEALPAASPGGLERESSELVGGADQLTVATFNVLNLDPSDGSPNPGSDDQLTRLSQDIVQRLNSPDIIAVQEIQDNDGPTDSGVTNAEVTLQRLVDGIAQSGGPTYEFVQIAPENNQDGGQPGANIQVAYLYNPERVGFVPQGEAGPTDEVQVVDGEDGAGLSLNPGRVDPGSPAFAENEQIGFEGTRKSLAAQFEFQGEDVFLVNNHFKSKSGDEPLFGENQPAFQNTLAQRVFQADEVNDFVDDLLQARPDANVVVLGDMNDFEFSETLKILAGDQLTNLVDQLPQSDRYSFNFDGNSQALDHLLVSTSLAGRAEIDIVHLNADFAEGGRSSDHDPVLARFDFGDGSEEGRLELVGRITPESGLPQAAGAEIVAHDPETQRLFITNGANGSVDVVSIADPTAPERLFSIDVDQVIEGGSVTSVAVKDGLVAVAVKNPDPAAEGFVALFDADGTYQGGAEVGVGPDHVGFTPDGTRVLTANEGEPVEGGDPQGSVSIVDVATPGFLKTSTEIGFGGFDAKVEELRDQGVRIFPNTLPSTDFEPEYLSVSADGKTAMVTLQENNAVAILDLETRQLTGIVPLGLKNHDQAGNGLDASDRDDGIAIDNWPVFGMYMPDNIASFQSGGATYYVIANEGDDRGEDERVKDLDLDPTAFPDADELQADEQIGRLGVSGIDGDTDGDGDHDVLQSYGARSFSVLDASGKIVFDSGDQFEQIIAKHLPEYFNSDNEENDSFDSRSDNKGPEPEGIAVGEVDGTPYAFVGLERVGGIMVFDLSDPHAPEFVTYMNSRDFSAPIDSLEAGDIGPEGLTFISAEDSPSGKPMIAVAHEISGTTALYEFTPPASEPGETFELQLLHASDLEGGVEAIDNAPNFAAIVEGLEQQAANTLVLSAGDNYLPGPFLNAAADPVFSENGVFNSVYNQLFGLDADGYAALERGAGRIDVSIMNVIGFDASAVGNHEFDLGTSAFASIIAADQGDADGVADDGWVGAQFPYLSANLDFSGDGALAGLFTGEILPSSDIASGPDQSEAGLDLPKLAPATVVDVNGEKIGVVGATTQLVETISSTGGVTVTGEPGGNDMAQLAEVLNPVIDQLQAQGIDKIVLASHLQQISLEEELVGLLDGVDIVIAGGSDTILADADDTLHPGDLAEAGYPILTENADGDAAVIVSTDGEYSYVGRLNVTFDADGVIIPDSIDPAMNGPIATTADNVAAIWGEADPFADGSKGALVAELVDAVSDIVAEQDGNVFGSTEVFLEGRRELVRTEETNLGDLSADANLAYARSVDPEVQVSIKNGGGIRSFIGEIGQDGSLLPPQGNPDAGKEPGDVSQLDIVNSLRFNNALSIVTTTAEGLKELLEHGVAATGEGSSPGQFPQVGGVAFSFDPDLEPGARVQSLAIVDEDGQVVDEVVQGGEVVGDAARAIKVTTLSFLADGGDGYPFPELISDRVDLFDEDAPALTGDAVFAPDGTEQDALAEYLAASFGETPFAIAETPADQDERIQNLALREDGVFMNPAGLTETLVPDMAAVA